MIMLKILLTATKIYPKREIISEMLPSLDIPPPHTLSC